MARKDDFPRATKQLIAQRSGYVCAFPNCLSPTSGPALDGEKAVNIGEAAHITAASENGPRYDSALTPEQRQGEDNGIWMCSTHATLIDRDVQRYPAELLREWKYNAEARAMKTLGQPKGCSAGQLASISPAARLGAETSVIVDGQPIPYATIFDVDSPDAKLTWFVNALVIQFSAQKKQNLKTTVVDHLVVTVHETKPVPHYQPVFAAYPAEVDLFYVEIESTSGTVPREFRPTRFYNKKTEASDEAQEFPRPIVLDDNVPAFIALRINARESGMFLISADVVVTSGELRETLPVMPPQWVILERPPVFGDVDSSSLEEALDGPPGDDSPLGTSGESLEKTSSNAEEEYSLYLVGKSSIDPLGIACSGWMELRRIYFERAKSANETLLAVQNGVVRHIQTRGGFVSHSQVPKWEPRDEPTQCGKRVLIIEAPGIEGRASMPPSQLSIIMSVKFREVVDKLVDGDSTGHPHLRFWPANIDCSLADKYWQLAMEFPRESLPSIVIMDSYTWRSFPLPLTVEETIALVQRHLC